MFVNNSVKIDNKTPIKSVSREVRSVDTDFIKFIRDIKGIDYNYKNRILTITEELNENDVRKILLWIDYFLKLYGGYVYLGQEIIGLYENLRSICDDAKDEIYDKNKGIIKGEGVFNVGSLPRFWMRWKAVYCIYDRKKAIATKILSRLLSIQYVINTIIHYNLSSDSSFREIVDHINNSIIMHNNGIKIESICADETGSADVHFFGKWQIKKDSKLNYFDRYKTNKEPLGEFICRNNVNINFCKDINIEKLFPAHIKKEIEKLKINESKWENIILLLKCFVEFNIHKKDFHWLHGFLIFQSWRKGGIKNYLNTISQPISNIRKIGEQTGLWKLENKTTSKQNYRQTRGFWAIKDIKINYCNINKSQELIKEAASSENEIKKQRILLEAISIYNDNLEGYTMLVESWQKTGFKDIEKKIELAKDVLDYLEKKDKIYKEALKVIKNHLKRKKDYWEHDDNKKTKREIEKVSNKIEYCRKILNKWCKSGIFFRFCQQKAKELCMNLSRSSDFCFRRLALHS